MTRQVLIDALNFEKIVTDFKDNIITIPDMNMEDAKEALAKMFVQAMKKLQSFWLVFSNFEKRIRGTADCLSRIDDRFRILYEATLRLGGGSYLWFGGTSNFSENIKSILETHETVKEDIPKFVSKFDHEEILRIQEAYHSLVEQCYWSSVINSAVALEKRLFTILKSRNTKFMKQVNPELRFTLGALIGLYIRNKEQFHTCIPHRHDNLLTLVNDYRIISAHSKQFDIDRATADAILNLTLTFLTDDECRPVSRKRK